MRINTAIGDFATYEALYWRMIETGKDIINCDIDYQGSRFTLNRVSLKEVAILKNKEYESNGLTEAQIKKSEILLTTIRRRDAPDALKKYLKE